MPGIFGLELELRISKNKGADANRDQVRSKPASSSHPQPPPTVVMPPGDLLDCDVWRVERRSDGALLVRVSSRPRPGNRLPEAVFSFRSGDPQYCFWEERFREQEMACG